MTDRDKPVVFNLDAVKSDVDLAPFRFAFKGKQYQLPHLSDGDAFPFFDGMVDGMSDGALMYRTFTLGLGAEALAQLRAAGMPGYKFNALLIAWQKHSGVTPGESPASTGS